MKWLPIQLDWRVGIKLGSWQTAFLVGKETKRVPTVVAYDKKQKKIVGVGEVANLMWGKTPPTVSVIRPIRRGEIIDPEKVLAFLETNLSGLYLNSSVKSLLQLDSTAYVSYSPHTTVVEQRFLSRVFQKVAFNKVFLLDKLLLALIGMGIDISLPQGFFLLYIGSQTSYITLFSLGGKVFEFYLPQGGEDVTNALVSYLRRRYTLRVSWQAMEGIKKRLSRGKAFPIYGYDLEKRRMRSIQLSYNEVKEISFSVLSDIIAKLRFSFNQLPPEFVADVNRNGLFLAGGGTLSADLASFLTDEFKIVVNTFAQPDLLVSQGLKEVLAQPAKYENFFLNF